jgi:hypothetical protein
MIMSFKILWNPQQGRHSNPHVRKPRGKCDHRGNPQFGNNVVLPWLKGGQVFCVNAVHLAVAIPDVADDGSEKCKPESGEKDRMRVAARGRCQSLRAHGCLCACTPMDFALLRKSRLCACHAAHCVLLMSLSTAAAPSTQHTIMPSPPGVK